MTPPSSLLDHLESAEIHIANARRSWNPLSLAACLDCTTYLEFAIQEMRAACGAAADSPVPSATKARLDHLRSDVGAFARLVDCAIAFGRGLPLQIEGDPLIASELRG